MAKKSNMAKAKTLYARMIKDNGGKRPDRQKVMKRLMGKAFGMTQAGASSYYGTLKDIAIKDLA